MPKLMVWSTYLMLVISLFNAAYTYATISDNSEDNPTQFALVYEEWNQIVRLTLTGKTQQLDTIFDTNLPSPFIKNDSLKKIKKLFQYTLGAYEFQMGSYPCQWEEPGGDIGETSFLLQASAICKQESDDIQFKIGLLTQNKSTTEILYSAYFNDGTKEYGILNTSNNIFQRKEIGFISSFGHARDFLALSVDSIQEKFQSSQEFSSSLMLLAFLVLLLGIQSLREFTVFSAVFAIMFCIGYSFVWVEMGILPFAFILGIVAIMLLFSIKIWVQYFFVGILAFCFSGSIPITESSYTVFPNLFGLQALAILNLLVFSIAYYFYSMPSFKRYNKKKLQIVKSTALMFISVSLFLN